MAPKPKEDETKIPCTSPAQLTAHIQDMQLLFSQPESEHNWEKFAKSLAKLAALIRGGAYKLDNFITLIGPGGLGGIGDKIVACMLTERAGLSKFALELLTSLAPRLNSSFTNHLPRQFIPPLLELIRRTNNIIRERAEACLFKILETCHLVLLIPYLTGAVKDSSVKLRKAVGSAMWIAVDQWGAGGKIAEVEMVVKALATDKDVDVRKVAKELWEKYKETWPDRVEDFSDPLTPTIRRRLDIKGTQQTSSSAGPSRPKASKAKPIGFLHPLSTSSTSQPSLLDSQTGRPRLQGLGSGPIRPTAFHTESFASSSRHALPPPAHPLASGPTRAVTHSGHPEHHAPPPSTLASSSSHRSVSSNPQPFASTSSHHRPPLSTHPSQPDHHSAKPTLPNPARSFDPSSSSHSTSSQWTLGHGRAASASSSSSSAPHRPDPPPATSSFRNNVASSRVASDGSSKRLGGKDLGMPVRGGEGGTRLGSEGMRDPLAPTRKPKPKGPVEAVLLEVSESNTTTPTSSPAKGALADVSMPSPQIGDLLQQRVDGGTDSPENLLLTDAPKSKISTTSRKIALLVQDSSTEMALPPSAPPPVRAVSPLDELVAAFVFPVLSAVKKEEEEAHAIPGFTLSVPTAESVQETASKLVVESKPVAEEGTDATVEPSLPSPPPPSLVLPEESPVLDPKLIVEDIKLVEVVEPTVEVVEVVPQPLVEEPTVVPAVEVKLPNMVALPPSPPPKSIHAPSHPPPPSNAPAKPTSHAGPSKLVRAPAKTFRPVSSASNTSSKPPHHPPPPAPRPKPVVSAPSVRIPPPPKPSSIPPLAPAAHPPSSSTTTATKPVHDASAAAAAPPPPVIKRTIMKMKAGGPPPKVEAEPRKERMKTKAPLPSFKPVSRIPSASGGPGLGTVKKEVGTKPVVAAGSATMVPKARVASVGVAKGSVKKEESSKPEVVASASQPPVASQPAPPASSNIEKSTVELPSAVEEEEKDSAPPQVEPATIPLPSSPKPHCIELPPSLPSSPAPTSLVPFPTSSSSIPSSLDLAHVVLNKHQRDYARPQTTSLISSSNGGETSTVFDDDEATDDGKGTGTPNESDEGEGVKFNPLAQKLREGRARTEQQQQQAKAKENEAAAGGEEGVFEGSLIEFEDAGEEVGKSGKIGKVVDSPRREFGVEKGNYLD